MTNFTPLTGCNRARLNSTLPRGLALAAFLVDLAILGPAQDASFLFTGSMNTSRALHTATVLLNGQVLVAGGGDASAEVYDPATGSWQTTGSLAAARASHTATLLPNGMVLAAGGSDPNSPSSSPISSAEVYDPATGTWAATGPLNTVREFHTATLLPSGRVLVAGGYDGTNALATAELYDPASGTWTLTGPMNDARADHTATLLPNGQVLIVGGDTGDGSEVYDPGTGRWTVTPGSDSVSYLFCHTATLLVDGRVLVAGGMGPGAVPLVEAFLYDSATGAWVATGNFNTGRESHTATLLPDGTVLAAGGGAGVLDAYPTSSAEVYDPRTGAWSRIDAMNTERWYHSASLLPNGQILVAGGEGAAPWGTLSSAELYGVPSVTWTPTGDMTNPRFQHTASLLTNGLVLAAGGQTTTGSVPQILASAELYNPTSGVWTVTDSLNYARWFHTATLLADGSLLVAGGDEDLTIAASALTSAEIYDPILGSWTPTGQMNDGHTQHTATLLANGEVLIAGGFNGLHSFSFYSAELYDPASGTWAPSGDLKTNRVGHTATLLNDGRVLVVGGVADAYNPTNILSSAELYDPLLGSWTETGSLTTRRQRHTSTLLPSGSVLVAGGENEFGTLSSTEVYDPATATWASSGEMVYPRHGHTATLLLDGKVLVAAGQNDTQPLLSSAELYDPATGTWTQTYPLSSARDSDTATLLPNGTVLAAGGILPQPTAELYGTGIPAGPVASQTTLTNIKLMANGWLVFTFTNTPGARFSVLATADPALASSTWTVAGALAEVSPGQFMFTDVQAENFPRRFYRLRSP